MVDRPSGPIGPWLTERLGLPPGSLLGTADVAALLGVTRQRVSQLQKEPTFPRAFTGYGGVKFWRGAGIECWAAGHRADGDRLGGRFVGEAAALLLSAEVRARELRVWWVDSMTVWLAVASGDAGLGLQSAVLSMGLTAEDIVIHIERWRPSDQRSKRTCRMDPHVQARLAAADRSAAEAGRDRVGPVDILVSFIDEPRSTARGARPRRITSLPPSSGVGWISASYAIGSWLRMATRRPSSSLASSDAAATMRRRGPTGSTSPRTRWATTRGRAGRGCRVCSDT